MEYEKNWEIQKQVRLLPLPLYMVYTNICAYASVADKLVTCTIEGDEEEARDEAWMRKANETTVDENNEDSDENEENDFDEPVQKNRHKRRTSKALLLNVKREELFKHHPLSVTFNINTKSKEEETLSITLIFIPALGFVTVQCRLNFDSQSVAAG
jgi:THO complex subunit 5